MIHVVIGASGFLGSYLLKELSESKVIATSRNEVVETISNESWLKLDVSNADSVDSFFNCLPESEDGYIFYYLAAVHHPDKVQENWRMAWQTNVVGLTYFLQRMPANADLIYASTDNVYGESKLFEHFDEASVNSPVNEYGKQKLLAEQIVLAKGYNVARYSFLIGPSIIDKPHFYDFIISSCQSSVTITLMSDSYRSAISFSDAAHFTVQLALRYYKQSFGIVNISSDECLSKYDVGRAIISEKEHDLLKPISFLEQDFFIAKRPQNVLLNNQKLKALLGLKRVHFNV